MSTGPIFFVSSESSSDFNFPSLVSPLFSATFCNLSSSLSLLSSVCVSLSTNTSFLDCASHKLVWIILSSFWCSNSSFLLTGCSERPTRFSYIVTSVSFNRSFKGTERVVSLSLSATALSDRRSLKTISNTRHISSTVSQLSSCFFNSLR